MRPAGVRAGLEKFSVAGAIATRDAVGHVEHAGRRQIDGRAFPDKVIALTWDDGPDVNTLALADYLKEQKIAATFFVVREWVGSFSSDPGTGRGVQSTGYDAIPILGDLVQLGHRLGNHTLNHVLFAGESAQTIDAQLRENQARIDSFTTNELRIFRAPGGAWNEAGLRAVDRDPALRGLVGPVRWDIDRKDWENSLACRSDHPHAECEAEGPEKRLRVRPAVTARRYLESIEEAGHGIVLFHDRVGDVGSRYALDVAQSLLPELASRGYVFAAPVLEFSALTTRFRIEASTRNAGAMPIHFGDLDGDGRADLCTADARGVVCAQARAIAPIEKGAMPTTAFHAILPMSARIEAAGWSDDRFVLADVDGDGAADACGRTRDRIVCLASNGHRDLRPLRAPHDFEGSIEAGDLDGDGKADICGQSAIGIVCARSLGDRFETPLVWLASTFDQAARLGDVNGDGRADLCVARIDGIACALSNGVTFGPLVTWSHATDGGDGELAFSLGDLNGDGRADLCARSPEGVSCAFSNGHAFTQRTSWLAASREATPGNAPQDAREGVKGWLPFDPHAPIALVDINGDGRADICAAGADGIACALAP